MQAIQLPVVAFSRSTFKASQDGIYVFTGTTSTLTVTAEYSPANWGADQSALYIIKNRGSGALTLASAGVNFFDGASASTLVLLPGQSVVLQYDGTYFAVVASSPSSGVTVANLPAASAALKGQRAVVTDANATYTSANVGATVAAGGANTVPVFCNGTNWVIG